MYPVDQAWLDSTAMFRASKSDHSARSAAGYPIHASGVKSGLGAEYTKTA
jgi:hypothetical protein